MALQVDFEFPAELKATLRNLAKDGQRAVVIAVKGEAMAQVGAPIPVGEHLTGDLVKVRATIGAMDSALVVLRPDPAVPNTTLVTCVTNAIKPKQKMLVATASTHLRTHGDCQLSGEHRVDEVAQIVPELFGISEEVREALRTDTEKANIEIAKQLKKEEEDAAARGEDTSRRVAMHEVAAGMPDATKEALVKVGAEGGAAVLVLQTKGGSSFDVEHVLPADKVPGGLAAVLPDGAPRFVVCKWAGGKNLLLYFVPAAAKPKDKMPYAAAKPSLSKNLKELEVPIARSLEFAATDNIEAAVNEELAAAPLEMAEEEKKAEAPADKPWMKGPRMFGLGPPGAAPSKPAA